MLGLVCNIRAEVAADDAVPGGVVLLVELLLDVRRNVLAKKQQLNNKIDIQQNTYTKNKDIQLITYNNIFK